LVRGKQFRQEKKSPSNGGKRNTKRKFASKAIERTWGGGNSERKEYWAQKITRLTVLTEKQTGGPKITRPFNGRDMGGEVSGGERNNRGVEPGQSRYQMRGKVAPREKNAPERKGKKKEGNQKQVGGSNPVPVVKGGGVGK